MDRLTLCQRTRRECGITGSGPSSTLNQTGELERIVGWVDSAYEEIQNLHENWEFLKDDFTFNTVAGTSEYSATDAGINATFGSWKTDSRDAFRIYSASGGVAGEQQLRYLRWQQFRAKWLLGSLRTSQQMPINFTVNPEKHIVLGGVPNDIYTIVGEYFKKADTMDANADVPLIPERFQMVIVWRAVRFYAAYDGDASLFASAQMNENKILAALEADQLPPICVAKSRV